ncbi:MAG: Fe2+-dependent dioxygenase [Rhodoferax sp.]|nr:Fe2+-dependent dioxygenase [Rhodoferax sp.]
MLLHLPAILHAEELSTAHAQLQQAPWQDGRDSAGGQAASVKNNTQLPRDCPAARSIRSLVLAALDRSALFFSAALPKQVFPPHVNRYAGEANHYGPHVDNAIRLLPDAGLRMRTDLSATLFLSDPDSYDGGALRIGQAPDAPRVKLPAGDLVLYDGTSVHEVEPVTRGERLACFFWVQSLVRDAAQRQILFDMDMALLDLRQRDGESPEAVRLTGCYHNLLRLWAEP